MVQFANGDGHTECRILGCRQPISSAKIDLLRKMERDTPWVPVILVTDRAPEVAHRLSNIRMAAVIWFADVRTELEPGIAAARQSVPLLHLAERVEEAKLPPALRSGMAYSFRAATHRPVRGVKELASAICCSPTTLSKEFRESVGGAANLSQFLSALTVVKAQELRLRGLSWDAVAKHLRLTRQTLHNKSTRWPGSTLKQLARTRQAPLLAKFVSDFAKPLLNASGADRPSIS
ncbi:MAG: hypothetical protein OXT63_02375 [Gemmatimonadota bacterium]|nr:hypothetical protein [Gemmatimonadota bacterium]